MEYRIFSDFWRIFSDGPSKIVTCEGLWKLLRWIFKDSFRKKYQSFERASLKNNFRGTTKALNFDFNSSFRRKTNRFRCIFKDYFWREYQSFLNEFLKHIYREILQILLKEYFQMKYKEYFQRANQSF